MTQFNDQTSEPPTWTPLRIGATSLAIALAGAGVGGGITLGLAGATAARAATTTSAPATTQAPPATGAPERTAPTSPEQDLPQPWQGRSRGSLGSGSWIPNGPAAAAGATAPVGEANDAQLVGVVDIVTDVRFGQGQAAGTGIVLTTDGRILTNNHVINGSTSITVTVLSTGKSYAADVVGTSPSHDIAVLQLSGAKGLATAALGDSSAVAVGDAVTGVGNAGNEPGTTASPGSVVALNESITAGDSSAASGGDSERLTGMIVTNAGIAAGDSGGPLYDANTRIVGINTAAQTSARTGATVAGYSIPINTALSVAEQIVAGVANDTIHQGRPAFLGVSLARQGTGATIAGTVSGSAAEAAGLVAGDSVTGVDGVSVSTASGLSAAIAPHKSGDRVVVSWVRPDGTTHEATVTLGAGPAD